jgi:hypothetical protein
VRALSTDEAIRQKNNKAQGIIARAKGRKRLAPASLPVVSAMLITLVVPLAILCAGKVLSVRYSTYKKVFAAGLIAVGLLEIVGFFQFSITINGVVYLIPQHLKIIILVQGFMTLLAGLLAFYSKTPKTIDTLQKVT